MRCAGLGLRSGLGPDRNHGGADRASMSPLHAGSFPLVCARHRASDPTRRPAGRQGRSSPHGGAWTDTGGRRVRVQRPDDRTADPTPGSSAPAMTQMSRPPPNPSGHNARLDEWVERWTPIARQAGRNPDLVGQGDSRRDGRRARHAAPYTRSSQSFNGWHRGARASERTSGQLAGASDIKASLSTPPSAFPRNGGLTTQLWATRQSGAMKRPTGAAVGRNAGETGTKSGKIRTCDASPEPRKSPANQDRLRNKRARLKIVVSRVRVPGSLVKPSVGERHGREAPQLALPGGPPKSVLGEDEAPPLCD